MREPLHDESASAEEVSVQSLPGYEEGNLGGEDIPSVLRTH
jgi:hypothetical protein